MLRKPLEIVNSSPSELQLSIQDIYLRRLGYLMYNTAVADIDVSGMAGDALTIGNKVNEILAMLRSARIIKEV